MADKPRAYAYLVALTAKSMGSRVEAIQWLKERDAVHVLSDVWFLTSHFRMAGDISHEITRWEDFDGQFVVIKLPSAADWAHHNLSEAADAWIRENLGE